MRCLFGAGSTLLRGPCKVSKKPGHGGSLASHRSKAATFSTVGRHRDTKGHANGNGRINRIDAEVSLD